MPCCKELSSFLELYYSTTSWVLEEKKGLKAYFKNYLKESDEKYKDFINSLNDTFQLCLDIGNL
jgi:hypothetical protein